MLDCLCSAVSGQQLQALNLSDNAIGARGVAAVSRALSGQRRLRRVLFNNNGLEGSAVRAIVDALLAPFAGSDSAGLSTTALEHAEFSRNLLHDDGPKALVPLLLASPRLQRFVVSRVSSDGGLAIADALTSLSSLVQLNLSDSTLGPAAGLVLARGLLVPDRTQQLTHLQLGDIGVNDRQESGQAIAAIIAALRRCCPHLQLLELQQNDIDSRLARRLAQALGNKPELTCLNLDDNALRSSGAAAIAAALSPVSHPRLQQLSLDNNGLTAAALPALLPLLASGRLQHLGLNSNRLSSAALEQLREAAAQAAQAADGGQQADGILGSLSDNEEPEEDEDEDEEEDGDADADVVGDAEAAEAAAEEREDADLQVDELAAQLDAALGSKTHA